MILSKSVAGHQWNMLVTSNKSLSLLLLSSFTSILASLPTATLHRRTRTHSKAGKIPSHLKGFATPCDTKYFPYAFSTCVLISTSYLFEQQPVKNLYDWNRLTRGSLKENIIYYWARITEWNKGLYLSCGAPGVMLKKSMKSSSLESASAS